jgi:hypothetical protein
MENLLVDYIDREKRGGKTEIGFFRLSPCLPWSHLKLIECTAHLFSDTAEEQKKFMERSTALQQVGNHGIWDAMGCHGKPMF